MDILNSTIILEGSSATTEKKNNYKPFPNAKIKRGEFKCTQEKMMLKNCFTFIVTARRGFLWGEKT